MTPPYYCVEATLDILVSGNLTVRLWIDIGHDVPAQPWTAPELIHRILMFSSSISHVDDTDLVQFCCKQIGPTLNAVQLIREYGQVKAGTMVYCVPFDQQSVAP